MAAIAGFFGKNASQVDAVEAEASLRKDLPQLLQGDEKLVLAFQDRAGKGRDSSYFTTKRIVVIDKKGLSGKKTDYVSIPNTSIKAYSIETAGSMDTDCELVVFASGYDKLKMDFVKGFDILKLQEHLNQVVLKGKAIGADVPTGSTVSTTAAPIQRK